MLDTQIIVNGKTTVCNIVREDGRVFKGIATCLPEDTYKAEIGRKIAIAKANLKYWANELRELIKLTKPAKRVGQNPAKVLLSAAYKKRTRNTPGQDTVNIGAGSGAAIDALTKD